MTAANLKVDVIKKITLLKKSHVIDTINRMLDFELDEGIFKFNAKQKASILEGKAEQKAGMILSEKKANKQIQKWLTK